MGSNQNILEGKDQIKKPIIGALIEVAEGKERSITFPGNKIQAGTVEIRNFTGE